MTQDEAIALIEHEYDDDDGLLIKFRMSDDVETVRLERFLEALEGMTAHYTGEAHVTKRHAYMIMSFRDTLSASAAHCKMSHPAALEGNRPTRMSFILG